MPVNHKLVILDRDGVINEDSDTYIKSASEWQAIPGSIEAIAKLNKAGFEVVIASNQSGLARHYFNLADLQAMHDKLSQLLANAGGKLSGIYFCPHLPDEHCQCRKPRPGLLEQIEADLNCSVRGVPFVGDSLKDLQSGASMGCLPILVKTGKGLKTLDEINNRNEWQELIIVEDLAAAADYIIEKL